MKKQRTIFFLGIFIALLILNSCSQTGAEARLFTKAYYQSSKSIITQYEKKLRDKNLSDYDHFIVANAYKKEKKYKKALLHFANSCFESKRISRLKPYPSPVYRFVDKFAFKSDLYNDAVFEIADIFYFFRESKYVLKFLDLIDDDNLALNKDILYLKVKALTHLKEYDKAISLLSDINEDQEEGREKALLNIKIASLYERKEDKVQAAKYYYEALKNDVRGWQGQVAAKRIYQLYEKEKIGLSDKTLLSEGLYWGKDYTKVLKLIDPEKISGKKEKEAALYVKSLIRKRKIKEADRFIKKYKSNKELYVLLNSAKADVYWFSRRIGKATDIYEKYLSKKFKKEHKLQLTRMVSFRFEQNEVKAEPLLKKYISTFKGDEKSEKFLWFRGKSLIERKKVMQAHKIFQQIIEEYPAGKYSANARFWCYKIYKRKKQHKKALICYKELVLYNPGSTYTWILTDRIKNSFKSKDLSEEFENAVDDSDKEKALFCHYLLFAKNGNHEEKEERVQLLNKQNMNRYAKLDQMFTDGYSYKDSLEGIAELLDIYFAAAYQKGISRTLRLFDTDKFKTFNLEKNTIVANKAHKYGYYAYAINATLGALNELKFPENISLMNNRSMKSLLPLGFKESIEKESQKYLLSKNRLYSVIRAESNFNHKAVSPAKAAGLMQLMPFTARDIARSLKIKKYELKDPAISIKFGAYYLAWLSKYFKNDFRDMIAGYNAGAGNVKKWKDLYKVKDRDVFLETIPFAETRFYILRIEKFLVQYNLIYGKDS
jgi:soluble lytic murein transglycosylase